MTEHIAAVVLAAGLSRRMGAPKMALPWGGTTVIGQVVSVLKLAGAQPVVVVTGGAAGQVAQALEGSGARLAHNALYENGEMLDSLRTGLAAVGPAAPAALMALGDQPHIQAGVVAALIRLYEGERPLLAVPSYQMRRGHPWLIDRRLWPEIMALPAGATMRDFLTRHAADIRYLSVDTSSVLQDLDTPEDYARSRPEAPRPR